MFVTSILELASSTRCLCTVYTDLRILIISPSLYEYAGIPPNKPRQISLTSRPYQHFSDDPLIRQSVV